MAGPYQCLFSQKYPGKSTSVYFTRASCGAKSDKLPVAVSNNIHRGMQTMWVVCQPGQHCNTESKSIKRYVIQHQGQLPLKWHTHHFTKAMANSVDVSKRRTYSNIQRGTPVGLTSKNGVWCIGYNAHSHTKNTGLSKFQGFVVINQKSATSMQQKWQANSTLNRNARKYGFYSMLHRRLLPTNTLKRYAASGKDIRCGCYLYQPSSGSRGWSATKGMKSCYTLSEASRRFNSLRKYY